MRSATVLLALLLLAAPALAEPGPGPFEVLDLGVRGRITERAYEDLDGDGRAELLLFDGHRLALHRPRPGVGYDTEPDLVLELDPDALYFCVGQVDADEKDRELVLVSARGVLYHDYRDGSFSREPRVLVESENIVQQGQRRWLHQRPVLQDLERDGLDDLVLATSRGFAIYHQRRHGEKEAHPEGDPGKWPDQPDRLLPYTIAATVTVGPATLGASVLGELGVPDFRIADFTGDGRPDFVMEDSRSLKIFPGGEDGRFVQEPSRELDLSPLLDSSGKVPRLTIEDVNGDRAPDFVFTRMREGVTDLFLSGRGLDAPAQRMKIPGWSFDARLEDLDGDGRLDLIIPTTPEIGVTTALSVAVTGAIRVGNYVFLNTGDAEAPYRKVPHVVRDIRVDIDLYVDLAGNIKATHSVLVDYGTDFNKDGRKDLVYRGGDAELLFFLGAETGVFESDPILSVEIPPAEGYEEIECRVRDLDGDDREDVALLYRSRRGRADRVVLLLTGGAK